MTDCFPCEHHKEPFWQRHALSLVLALVVLTRIPFLFTGYGVDHDAWLVAAAASSFWHTGAYQPSRLPGYPLHELSAAPLVALGGATLSNTATLVAALCAIVVWWSVARQMALHPFILLLTFAFAPVFWQQSAVTLDYVWSLLFILLALQRAINNKVLSSGMMIGIAAGFRLPNILAILPLAALLIMQRVQRKAVAQFASAAAVVAFIAFLPLMAKYGGIVGWIESTQREMSDMVFPARERFEAFLYRSVYFFGPLAVGLLLSLCIRGRRTLRDAIRRREPIVIASLVALLAFLGLMLWLPVERAYLLPILPFILLLLDRIVSRPMLAAFAVALVFHGLVSLDVVRREAGEKSFGFNVHAGMVVEEVHNRLLLLRERTFFSTYRYPDRSIVMVGGGASFWFENDRVKPIALNEPFSTLRAFDGIPLHRLAVQAANATVFFLPYLFMNELEMLQQQGYTVFCTERARHHVERVVSYSMQSHGVIVVNYEQRGHSL